MMCQTNKKTDFTIYMVGLAKARPSNASMKLRTQQPSVFVNKQLFRDSLIITLVTQVCGYDVIK